MSKELLYPHFLNCVDYTDDEFWKGVFEDMAFGETPQGIYISKNHVQCNVKGKEFVYKIKPDDNSGKVFSDLFNLFTTKIKLSSPTEMAASRQIVENESDIVNELWSSIKKKSIKDIIITNYVIEISKEYDLPREESKRLLDMIILFITLKIISSQDIIYKNGHIKDISGLSFNREERTFKFDRDLDIDLSPIDTFNTDKQMIDEWKRFILGLEKNIFTNED